MKTLEEINELAIKNYPVNSVDSLSEILTARLAYTRGYFQAQRELFNEDDMINLIQLLKDYTRESHSILGFDERNAKELLEIYENIRRNKRIS